MTIKPIRTPFTLLLIALAIIAGCSSPDPRTVVTLWHQMTPNERELLDRQIQRFQEQNPDIRIRTLYKETEELRSAFQVAALVDSGPDLLFGPSDAVGPFQTMGIIRDMSPWFDAAAQKELIEAALTFLPSHDDPSKRDLVQVGDRIGNHLALVYNRNLVDDPPQTTDELLELAIANTKDSNGDGRTDQYGLVWNFKEPFFAVPFLTGFGAWVFDEQDPVKPALDTPEAVAAYKFVHAIRDKHQVVPASCDYETADSLFKEGRAAMIINGDWSWGDYLNTKGIDAAVAPLPIVSETGKPMGGMFAPRGYSLRASVSSEQVVAAAKFVHFMISEPIQRQLMTQLKVLPTSRKLLDDPLIQQDPTLRSSAEQMNNGRPMPVVAELRAVWDSMRPHYQALLGGSDNAVDAAAKMQRDAEQTIRQMNQQTTPGSAGMLTQILSAVLVMAVAVWQRKSFVQFFRDWSKNRLAYLFVVPCMIVIVLTIVFPFFYNVVLSLSNMSSQNYLDWQVVGWHNYVEVLTEYQFLTVFVKTIIWTAINVFFHVSIGLLLAVALHGVVRGKSIYRVLLILPWAIPAYITALTWRGMFHADYGAVNLIISRYLSVPMINWLDSPLEAFTACIVTNVWLGFPFMMVIALGGMQGIPQELYEAARVDRASRWDQFRLITLPLLRPVLIPAVTLGAIWTFNNLNVIWLVSNGGEPSDKTHILVSYVYKAVFNLYRYGYGAALSMIMFFLLLAFSLIFLRRTDATKSVY